MAVDIRIPPLGESITEATLVRWLKADGARVEADEVVLELETEKAAMEVQAETAGRLSIVVPAGSRVQPGAVVGRITEQAPAERAAAAERAASVERAAPAERAAPVESAGAAKATREPARPPAPAPSEPPPRTEAPTHTDAAPSAEASPRSEAPRTEAPPPAEAPAQRETPPRVEPPRPPTTPHDGDGRGVAASETDADREPMSQLRRTIAARLVEAQRTAAILTTFNEVDLGELMALRARHRERFRARHGVDLGLMSLFARAVVHGLREVPILNARIDGTDIVKPRRVHLGIAVSTPRGLVVPVVRDADGQTLAALEKAIGDVARRARDGKLAPGDLAGGTFTITNGGVFGSLLSTPILNPPQSGILGMHKIEDRPVARAGQVVIRPMMYVAVSYDHRLVDGEQAVTFLVRVKEALEDPARMVLEV
jgi:2-oxoglutarate dehydrogenase E2 component (dihydrolipoamide succinyltransferase)